jgi:hypothetical protein
VNTVMNNRVSQRTVKFLAIWAKSRFCSMELVSDMVLTFNCRDMITFHNYKWTRTYEIAGARAVSTYLCCWENNFNWLFSEII